MAKIFASGTYGKMVILPVDSAASFAAAFPASRTSHFFTHGLPAILQMTTSKIEEHRLTNNDEIRVCDYFRQPN